MGITWNIAEPADLIEIESFHHPNIWYTVNKRKQTCTCPIFVEHSDKSCKHMDNLFVYKHKPFTPKTYPTFSQALAGLVKSIRVRDIREAFYWLVYLDRYNPADAHPSYRKSVQDMRFLTARRILIGSAEDGVSVSVMDKVSNNFVNNTKLDTPLMYLGGDLLRVMRVPNWWGDAGGRQYIYDGMVGYRMYTDRGVTHDIEKLQPQILHAIETGNRIQAVGALMGITKVNHTKLAQMLLEIATKRDHELARHLLSIHLKHKGPLSGDNNFLCQAAWYMAGGQSERINSIQNVQAGEVVELINQANQDWTNPHPIPRWCCDGFHSAGDDTRFRGSWHDMNAVCNAFLKYGNMNPDNKWLQDFYSYDGLNIKFPTSGAY